MNDTTNVEAAVNLDALANDGFLAGRNWNPIPSWWPWVGSNQNGYPWPTYGPLPTWWKLPAMLTC